MKRRGFLLGIASLFASRAVPALPVPAPIRAEVTGMALMARLGPTIEQGWISKSAYAAALNQAWVDDVLFYSGTHWDLPPKKGDTLVFRRPIPYRRKGQP